MKTHFDPYFANEESMYPGESSVPDIAPCGTVVGLEYYAAQSWSGVTCERCLKVKDRLQMSFMQTEEIVIEQMRDMAEFFELKKLRGYE